MFRNVTPSNNFPALQMDSLPTELSGKPKKQTGGIAFTLFSLILWTSTTLKKDADKQMLTDVSPYK